MDERKIAIIRRDMGIFGGIERQILMLSRALIQEGIQVYFITNNVESKLAKDMARNGVIIIVHDLSDVFKAGKWLARFCKSKGIQIIQSHMLKESFIARVAKLYYSWIKHIFRIHTYIDCSQIPQRKKDFYHMLSKLTDFLVDRYVSINEFNIVELVNRTKINRKKINLLHNGIPCIDLEVTPISTPINSIAMIANFIPFKGHDILVKGLKLLTDEGIVINATIIGGESYAKGLDQTPVVTNGILELSRNLGVESQLTLTGFVSNVHEIIKDIPVVVLPSYSEGTPNCLLESMSLKRIVVASDVGGVPEFIHDGENGFLHESRSPESFAAAIKKVLALNKSELNIIAENGFNTWRNEFSENEVCKHYIKLINNFFEER